MKFFIHNLQIIRCLSSLFQEKKVRVGLIVAIIGAIVIGGANNLEAEPVGTGKLQIATHVYDNDFIRRPHTTVHYPGASEGIDDYDGRYYPMPYYFATKIISKIPDYEHELKIDVRPFDSLTPVNLELSLHSSSGGPMTISRNELWCSMPLAGEPYFWDFGNKPITLWQREPNDPNNITFMGDIEEVIEKSDVYIQNPSLPGLMPVGIIPLPELVGTYQSEVPYLYAQIRFNTFPGDFDLSGTVDLGDVACIGENWMRTDVNSVADISGPSGLPDKNVDAYDLSLFTRDYLKDANDPNTWSRVR